VLARRANLAVLANDRAACGSRVSGSAMSGAAGCASIHAIGSLKASGLSWRCCSRPATNTSGV